MEYIPVLYFLFTIAAASYLLYALVYNDKMKKRQRIVFSILLAVLTLALFPVNIFLGTLTLHGELESSVFYHGTGGDFLVVSARVQQGTTAKGWESFRLESINLANGKVAGRVSLVSPESILQESEGHIWFYNQDQGIQVRTPDTLQVLADEKSFIAQNPQLAKGINAERFFIDPVSHNVVVNTQDGYLFAIDDASLKVTPFPQEKSQTLKEISLDQPDEYELPETTLADHTSLRMEGDPRVQIQKKQGTNFVPLTQNSPPTFLDGWFLRDTFTYRHVEVDSPAGVLVVYKQAMDDSATSMIARVGLDGTLAWTRQVVDPSDDAFLKGDHLLGNTLIVVTSRKVMALNVADGSVVWTTDF